MLELRKGIDILSKIGGIQSLDEAQALFSQKLDAENQAKLAEMINDPEIKNLLEFVNMSLSELEEIVKKPFSLDNAQLVLDLSESMLREASMWWTP